VIVSTFCLCRTIDDCSRIFPAAAGNDPPLLWNRLVEAPVDMAIRTPNVPVPSPNLVGVLAHRNEPELLVPRVISTAE